VTGSGLMPQFKIWKRSKIARKIRFVTFASLPFYLWSLLIHVFGHSIWYLMPVSWMPFQFEWMYVLWSTYYVVIQFHAFVKDSFNQMDPINDWYPVSFVTVADTEIATKDSISSVWESKGVVSPDILFQHCNLTVLKLDVHLYFAPLF